MKRKSPNPAGRPKGSLNRRSLELAARVQAYALEHHGVADYDPVLSLVGLALTKSTPLDIKVQCHKAVIPYLHAAKKAVEVKVEGNIDVRMGLVDQLLEVIGATVIDNEADPSNLLDVIQASEDKDDDTE